MANMAKYELKETKKIEFDGEIYEVRQIQATKRFTTITGIVVEEGELGGYIQEGTLDQEGNSWVSHNVYVVGDSWVSGDAFIKASQFPTLVVDSTIEGHAKVLASDPLLMYEHEYEEEDERIQFLWNREYGIKILYSHISESAILRGGMKIRSSKVYGNAHLDGKFDCFSSKELEVLESTVCGNAYVGWLSQIWDSNVGGNAYIDAEPTISACNVGGHAHIDNNWHYSSETLK